MVARSLTFTGKYEQKVKKYAIIVAAGTGTRMGGGKPKQFLPLRGKPMIWYTLDAFLKAYADLEVILVLQEDQILEGSEALGMLDDAERVVIARGGETRFHSVWNGLRMVADPSVVFVHDGVRCLLSTRLIRRCYDETIAHGNAIPFTRPVDSLRIEQTGGTTILDRQKICIIQTPQTFYSDQLRDAFNRAPDSGFTDEAGVAEHAGIHLNLVEGEKSNIKITQPEDLVIAEKMIDFLDGLRL